MFYYTCKRCGRTWVDSENRDTGKHIIEEEGGHLYIDDIILGEIPEFTYYIGYYTIYIGNKEFNLYSLRVEAEPITDEYCVVCDSIKKEKDM